MPPALHAFQNTALEWSYVSGKAYGDPFNEIELDVAFTDPEGGTSTVPAFWAGDREWRVRFRAETCGRYRFRTICSDEANGDLHGREGTLTVEPYAGSNPLLQHGPLRISKNRRFLEHADGTPFFWLADTWWMGLSKRLSWPDDFQCLTADRQAKGFTVVQLVAGLYPDMPAFDERSANEAAFAWEDAFVRINPAYFDMADLRIRWLVRSGLVPCIVGAWGYYLPWLGVERMKRHWRYLVARYGAYPVVWCIAGEGVMPYYLSKDKEKDAAIQKAGWTQVARYVREIDSYHHLITIHPTAVGRDQIEDPALLDFDMLQTGHGGYESIPDTVTRMMEAIRRHPRMPVIDGEVCYEGILESNREEIQRFMFWACMLSGAAGHTYGANGIWQVNTKETPYGPSPHGASWGDTPWEQAYRLPGSSHLAAGKKILQRCEWWRFEAHQEWIEPSASPKNFLQPYAAGIEKEIRVIYFPRPIAAWSNPFRVKALEVDTRYQASFVDPKDGKEFPMGAVERTSQGDWPVPAPAVLQDWVLVLRRSAGK